MAFQQALVAAGFTPAEFRLQMIEQTRAELLTQRYLGQRVSELKPVPISEQEVRQRFELQKSALGPKPASVSIRQLVLIPHPSPDAELEAEAKAEQALSRARSGEDFGRLAHEYSEDPGSRDNDGELGWMRRGQLLPEFEDELFEMRPGEISDIVKTSVGYHIIKLQRVRGAERFASHILVRAEITAEDEALVERQAREAAAALRAGADPDSISFLYHDKEEREVLNNQPQDRLPPIYRQNLQGANTGDVVGPFELPIPGFEISKLSNLICAAEPLMKTACPWVSEISPESVRKN